MRTAAIIGGGFCGTMAAVNLARYADQPLHIVVINSRRPFGRGTAYGTKRREHLLNVAARNMSAFPDHPAHFFDWLRSRSEYDEMPDDVLREQFVPRQIYGDYIRGLASHFLGTSDPRSVAQCEVVDEMAVDVMPGENDGIVMLESGESIKADSVLLATGNQPPASLKGQPALARDSRYCADPWANWHDHIPPDDGQIVLLGTGLTMVDAVVTLREMNWQGHITAISRNGMLPQCHFRGIAWPEVIPDDASSMKLSQIVSLVEQNCERLRQISQNPAIAIDKLRPHTQQLWRNLSVEERRLFLDRYAARWNVIRHRIAQPIHERVTDSLDCGQLTIQAGAIESLVAGDDGIKVNLRNTDGQSESVKGDLVINCTGPQSRFSETELPLFRNLLDRGLVSPDELDMGIQVDDGFAVIQRDGTPSTHLYAIGPPLKGSLWETTAVPELRGQAMRVAQIMLEQHPIETAEDDVIEYCI